MHFASLLRSQSQALLKQPLVARTLYQSVHYRSLIQQKHLVHRWSLVLWNVPGLWGPCHTLRGINVGWRRGAFPNFQCLAFRSCFTQGLGFLSSSEEEALAEKVAVQTPSISTAWCWSCFESKMDVSVYRHSVTLCHFEHLSLRLHHNPQVDFDCKAWCHSWKVLAKLWLLQVLVNPTNFPCEYIGLIVGFSVFRCQIYSNLIWGVHFFDLTTRRLDKALAVPLHGRSPGARWSYSEAMPFCVSIWTTWVRGKFKSLVAL